MNKLFLTVTFLCLLSSNAMSATVCGMEFAEKMEKCIHYKCSVPHPLVKGFIEERIITGKSADGTCRYSASMPGGGLLSCNYSKKTREAFSRLALRQAQGVSESVRVKANLFTGEQQFSSPNNDNVILNAAMNNECKISGY